VGQLVRAGQQIAKAGSSGRSTGAHVHFEVWENGRVVNPHQFLRRTGRLRG
jgi:murein DD-endopeptidase MepM/ murein hydrolase activator NlpD